MLELGLESRALLFGVWALPLLVALLPTDLAIVVVLLGATVGRSVGFVLCVNVSVDLAVVVVLKGAAVSRSVRHSP